MTIVKRDYFTSEATLNLRSTVYINNYENYNLLQEMLEE